MVLVAIGIVVVSLLNVTLFGYCTIGYRTVLMSKDFNFAIVFAALFTILLFNVALFYYCTAISILYYLMLHFFHFALSILHN